MDSTLQSLGGILLKAIPTVFLLAIVWVYLRWMFFGPLEKILAQRAAATSGALKEAESYRAKVHEAQSAIEAAISKARDEIYQEQEAARREWVSGQAAHLEQARSQSRQQIQKAREELAADVVAAKRALEASASGLADQVAQSLLERRTA